MRLLSAVVVCGLLTSPAHAQRVTRDGLGGQLPDALGPLGGLKVECLDGCAGGPGGGGDGAILDGAVPTIQATVFDFTNSNPLAVGLVGSDGSYLSTLPVSAVSWPLPTGAATEATLSGVLTTAAFQARINTLGQKTAANSTPVVLASDQPAIPVSGTVTTSPPTNASTNVAQFGGSAVVTGTGASGAGIPRVTFSNDSAIANTAFGLTQTGTNNDVDVVTAVVPTGLTTVTTGQQAVTGTATALPSTAGRIVCVKVLEAGTQNVFFGPSGVTTGTGMQLLPGEGVCRPVDNANRFFVIATTTGSTVAYEVY